MGALACFLYIAVALTIFTEVAGLGGCPPRNKVPGYKQTCVANSDCKNGMICCPNQSNTKSCTYPAPH